jgi:ubiquinone/menaquinone biosynthesis C-methylase UbiE
MTIHESFHDPEGDEALVMSSFRTGRRRYYDIFSNVYDAFIRLHSRRGEQDTRRVLVTAAKAEAGAGSRILDLCCGTGAVVLAFAETYPDALSVGCDFSRGMLQKARRKTMGKQALFIEADAAELPFADGRFDVVTCSHALYELKGESREKALWEMKRVSRPGGCVLLMEHEVPANPVLRLLFYVRLFSMGSEDARDFVTGGLERLRRIFPEVTLSGSPSGKSRLMRCRT